MFGENECELLHQCKIYQHLYLKCFGGIKYFDFELSYNITLHLTISSNISQIPLSSGGIFIFSTAWFPKAWCCTEELQWLH